MFKERRQISILDIHELKELLSCVKQKDFTRAMTIFDTLKQNGTFPMGKQQSNIYNAVLNVCYKKEHLSRALEILDLMKKSNTKQGEAANLCLIRCYADAGMFDEARAIINTMMANSIEPKLRAFHPILKGLCEEADLEKILEVLEFMKDVNVNLRPEQIVVMARMLTQDRQLFSNAHYRGIFEDAMQIVSKEVVELVVMTCFLLVLCLF